MKILFIRQYNPFYENSASANRFAGLLKGLIACGVQVDMIVCHGYWSLREFKEGGIPHGMDLRVRYTCSVFNQNIWFRRINSFILIGLMNYINSRKVKKAFKMKYDYIWLTKDTVVLNTFNTNPGFVAHTLIELNEFNDFYKQIGSVGNVAQFKKLVKEDDELMAAIKEIDCFACMTQTLLMHYRKMAKPEARFMHLPMTVDMRRFQNITGTQLYKKPYIAFTGTFNNAKDGVDVLIKAFAKISVKYPSYHLYLAGFWHYDVPMQEKLIKDLGLSDRVTYLGVLNKDQIPMFVCNAALLVLSRPDSHQAQGGFPTKLGEYLATGNPVCVTKVGEIPDYLEDNVSAFMAEPGDVDSFADAMDRALRDPENARKVGLRGRKVAETEFNAEIQAKRLYEFLQENLK